MLGWRKKMPNLQDYQKEFGGKCQECGSTDRLNFHHIDPESKSFEISKNKPEKETRFELLKCALFCYRCHRKEHARYNRDRKLRRVWIYLHDFIIEKIDKEAKRNHIQFSAAMRMIVNAGLNTFVEPAWQPSDEKKFVKALTGNCEEM
jgi:hypothetical protein